MEKKKKEAKDGETCSLKENKMVKKKTTKSRD